MKNTKIAQRYAKAFLDFSIEKNLLEAANNDMLLVSTVCSENRKLRLVLSSPVIRTGKKQSIITEIFSKHINKISSLFISIITKKGREEFVYDIAMQFNKLYKEEMGIKTAILKTAVAIDDELRKNIIKILEEDTSSKIELSEEIDENLIGGFLLTIGDKQYDASILSKIKKLTKEFEVNIYEKGF